MLPFGARVRLKSSFTSPSKNPYTQTLIRQLKEYGLIVADIGGQWAVQAEDIDLYFDPEILAAFREIAGTVGGSSLEVVDESGLMINGGSGDTNVDAETVVATDRSNGKTATARVILTGVTVGSEAQYMVFQAGAAAHPLKAWVNGSSDQAVLWSMKPSVGSLSATGVYTPPSSISTPQTTLITAKARAEPTVLTTIAITLLPEGTIRIDNGSSSPYTDSKSHVWYANCCTPFATVYSYDGFRWPKKPDIKLYIDDSVAWSDIQYAFYVKPGNYRITAKMAEPSNTTPGIRLMHLDSQGQLIYRNVDLFALAGVRNPIDFDLPAVVGDDGKLEFWVRHVLGEQALLSALQIAPDSGTPRVQVSPSSGGQLTLSQTKQFYAVRWFTPSPSIRWSISPNIGSIDANGRYTAPAAPLSQDTVVTVSATSTNDPKLTASSTLTIKKGIPTIRVNCGGSEFTDSQGNVWAGDYGFQGGLHYDGNIPIKGASPDMQPLYRTSRYGYGTDGFSYSFSLPNGLYAVTLKWAEYRTAGEVAAERIAYKMNVNINGQLVLTNFDSISAAGGALAAYDRTFRVTVSRGELHIAFSGQPGAGYVGSGINGIEIEPAGAPQVQ